MAQTGHTTTLTFGTSGFTAAATEIGGATHSRESLKDSDLATTGYDTFQPGDTVDGGESTMTFFFNPSVQPPITGALESIVKTYPVPSGMSNGATKTQNGFITSWEEPTAVSNELMMSTVTIKWSGNPVYAAAS